MEDRHESDYDLGASIGKQDAEENLHGAQQFVAEVETWLKQQNWL
jgi:predicted XRE-type DNA-binding protein